MGTNYYYYPKEACKCCNRGYEPIHIGKSSYGWVFSLHILNDLEAEEAGVRIRSLEDWKELFKVPGSYIENEYGGRISMDEMLAWITKRKGKEREGYPPPDYGVLGPNNLLRHEIGDHCVAHGEGTWDLIEGYFS